MLMYLIIGIEVAILYIAFWYIFIRETKPYKLKENMWGKYDCANKKFTKFVDDVDYSSSSDREWLENNFEVLQDLRTKYDTRSDIGGLQ